MADTPNEPGRYTCDVPGFENNWIQFRPRGYTWKFRRQWQNEKHDERVLLMVLRNTTAWDLRALNGAALPLPTAETLDEWQARLDNRRQRPSETAAEWQTRLAAEQIDVDEPVVTLFDDADEAVVIWLIRTFSRFVIWDATASPKG